MKINDEVVIDADEHILYENSFKKELSSINIDFGQSKFHRRLSGNGRIIWMNEVIAILDHSYSLEDLEVAPYFLSELKEV